MQFVVFMTTIKRHLLFYYLYSTCIGKHMICCVCGNTFNSVLSQADSLNRLWACPNCPNWCAGSYRHRWLWADQGVHCGRGETSCVRPACQTVQHHHQLPHTVRWCVYFICVCVFLSPSSRSTLMCLLHLCVSFFLLSTRCLWPTHPNTHRHTHILLQPLSLGWLGVLTAAINFPTLILCVCVCVCCGCVCLMCTFVAQVQWNDEGTAGPCDKACGRRPARHSQHPTARRHSVWTVALERSLCPQGSLGFLCLHVFLFVCLFINHK
jgi:hypothetical protein